MRCVDTFADKVIGLVAEIMKEKRNAAIIDNL